MTVSLSDRILPVPPSPISEASVDSFADEFTRALASLYERVDGEIAARKPVCINRGACCRFQAYGHRLYVTAPELRYFVAGMSDTALPVPDGATDCSYHQQGQCTARQHRPLGCRIFYCDEAAQDWQGLLYERFLAELKAIGDRFGLDYAYREWLSALRDAHDRAVKLPEAAARGRFSHSAQ